MNIQENLSGEKGNAFENEPRMKFENLAKNSQSAESDSDSSIDAAVDGTMDQRDDGLGDCFCKNSRYIQNKQKKLLSKELQC